MPECEVSPALLAACRTFLAGVSVAPERTQERRARLDFIAKDGPFLQWHPMAMAGALAILRARYPMLTQERLEYALMALAEHLLMGAGFRGEIVLLKRLRIESLLAAVDPSDLEARLARMLCVLREEADEVTGDSAS
jgi:hypothetical protein